MLYALGLTSDEASAIIYSCGAVLAALLALLGVLVPILIALLRRTKRTEAHARETVEQVSNDHSTNLRVENDQRHAETLRLLDELGVQMRANDRRTGRRFARIDRRIDLLRNRLDDVEENTIPRPPVRRKK